MRPKKIAQRVGAAACLVAVVVGASFWLSQSPPLIGEPVVKAATASGDQTQGDAEAEIVASCERLIRATIRTMPTRGAVAKITHVDPVQETWEIVRDGVKVTATKDDVVEGWTLTGHLRPQRDDGYLYPIRAEIMIDSAGTRRRLVRLHFDGERVFLREAR